MSHNFKNTNLRIKKGKSVDEDKLLQDKINKIKKQSRHNNNAKNQIPIKAKVLLNPLRIYSLFGKIPLALTFHLLVIIMDGWYLIQNATEMNNFLRPSKIFLYQ
jgi:hypothetical protein